MRPECIPSQWYYSYVLDRIKQLNDAVPGTPEAEELRRLAELAAEHERRSAANGDSKPGEPL